MSILSNIRFDKRILERNLASGVVSEDEVLRHLKQLKDLESESVPVEAQLIPIGHPVPGRKLEEEEDL
jgi:hypothetical protein